MKKQEVDIRLSKDSQSVCLTGLEYAILHDLKTDTLNTEAWQSLFAVYRIPADTDMKDLQKPQPGNYIVTDTSIVFKPDTAFAKHQSYFAHFYGGPLAAGKLELVQAKTKLEGQHYKEVVFNF
ncbi:hypothetical protein KXQ82_02930 [Mucilaginibacter sp. HMF5004]|uniref:hypothetical protein n=1 Tax=Mucilaginibacter rivuli TaxID=2857527 RepID=UPI001C6060DF|nr:hypothetical protein [Mucilaginibacter rivuli]MBW4888648.1 hypothetical protein [Mucilaginibacter rivuli]